MLPFCAPMSVKRYVNYDAGHDIPTQNTKKFIIDTRKIIRRILIGEDSRILLVAGPCSAHDPQKDLEFAKKLASLRNDPQINSKVEIVGRFPGEKPRSATGWKGIVFSSEGEKINIEKGLRVYRKLLADIVALGLPVATELLYPQTYLSWADLLSIGWIGSRTSDSQPHREMASNNVEFPIGIKNPLSGDLNSTVNSIVAVRSSHTFLADDEAGSINVIESQGNPFAFAILRGGSNHENYNCDSVSNLLGLLEKKKIPLRALGIDCAHGNCINEYGKKDPALQVRGVESILKMRREGLLKGVGCMLMLEAFLERGMSKTDPVIGWDELEKIVEKICRG